VPVACYVCGADSPPGQTKCALHQGRPWYEGSWEKFARAYRQAHPICEVCRQAPSQDVHHVVARSQEGGYKAVCRPCHRLLEAQEARPTDR
jgi:hypothetical protein